MNLTPIWPPFVWLAGAVLTYWVAERRSGGIPRDDRLAAAVTVLCFWWLLLPLIGVFAFYHWAFRRFLK